AEVLPNSYHILDAIAATLEGNPDIELVEIQGHADERGSDSYNIQLTQDRSAAVRLGLIRRGVDANRMRNAGYGERCPIDPRHTAAAWEQNRRVELKIIRRSDGSTFRDIVCPAGRSLTPAE
ncbi:MAG: OmpA family protein, partial [Myxococcota bacterium]